MGKDGMDAILGRVPSGLFVLTCTAGRQTTGMLASWVMQAGFSPPTVTVAVKSGRFLTDWLTEGRPFALNVLGENNKDLIKHFARGFEPDDAGAFTGIDHDGDGPPVLRDAIGHLLCQVIGHMDSPDHRIFLARVVDGKLRSDDRPTVHIRRSGLRY